MIQRIANLVLRSDGAEGLEFPSWNDKEDLEPGSSLEESFIEHGRMIPRSGFAAEKNKKPDRVSEPAVVVEGSLEP